MQLRVLCFRHGFGSQQQSGDRSPGCRRVPSGRKCRVRGPARLQLGTSFTFRHEAGKMYWEETAREMGNQERVVHRGCGKRDFEVGERDRHRPHCRRPSPYPFSPPLIARAAGGHAFLGTLPASALRAHVSLRHGTFSGPRGDCSAKCRHSLEGRELTPESGGGWGKQEPSGKSPNLPSSKLDPTRFFEDPQRGLSSGCPLQ